MPAETVIGHIHLHVGDLDRAAEFYHGALGLDRTVWNYPGALFLSAGGDHHHLGLNSWARGTEPAGEDDAQLLEWELCVPTVEAARGAMASLAAAGFPVAEESGEGVVREPWEIALRIRARRE